MDFSNLHLPEGLTHLSLTLIGDNNNIIRNIGHVEHFHKAGTQTENKLISPKYKKQLVDDIACCFRSVDDRSNVDWAQEFLKTITGLKPADVTKIVRAWTEKSILIECMTTWSALGRPLFNARLYVLKDASSAENNWNKRVKIN